MKAAKPSLAWRPDAGPGARRRLQAALGLPKLEADLRQVVAATAAGWRAIASKPSRRSS